MAKRPVIIQIATEPQTPAAFAAATGDQMGAAFAVAAAGDGDIAAAMTETAALPGLEIDLSFSPVPIPEAFETVSRAAFDFAADGEAETEAGEPTTETLVTSYIIRGLVEEDEAEALAARDDVIGVFADVQIQPMLICPNSPPLGNHQDVERLLCASRLHSLGADGRSVLVAIVDTGVNMAYLNAHGKTPNFDAARSWAPQAGLVPGSMPVGHGTMCAFDVCIAAPKCTILDIALLASTASGGSIMDGFLSDAVRAYNHLANIMRAPRRPGETRSLVVNNSWGMFHPSWDFPVGHPGNYSDNPLHPFNVIVGTLEALGADILFAAGNCGSNCPDGRCKGVTSNAIYGANGHDKVLCVAGVDTTKQRVGYSTRGPGRLTRNKPDLCGYTHFAGSGVYAADGGTSAATPVVAGVVAAYRTKRPFEPGNPSVSPGAVRNLMRSSCQDLGAAGYDFDHGYGVINGCAIADNLRLRQEPIDICRIIPRLCQPFPVPIDFCQRYPQLCRPQPGPLPGPLPGPRPSLDAGTQGMMDLGANAEGLESLSREDMMELVYRLGYQQALEGSGAGSPSPAPAGGGGAKAKCGCGGD